MSCEHQGISQVWMLKNTHARTHTRAHTTNHAHTIQILQYFVDAPSLSLVNKTYRRHNFCRCLRPYFVPCQLLSTLMTLFPLPRFTPPPPPSFLRQDACLAFSLRDPLLCYQAGHMTNAAVTWDPRYRGRCSGGPPANRVWFTVAVRVAGDRADVLLDNVLIVSPLPYFRSTGRAGVLTLKGFNNIVYFSDIQFRSRSRNPGE